MLRQRDGIIVNCKQYTCFKEVWSLIPVPLIHSCCRCSSLTFAKCLSSPSVSQTLIFASALLQRPMPLFWLEMIPLTDLTESHMMSRCRIGSKHVESLMSFWTFQAREAQVASISFSVIFFIVGMSPPWNQPFRSKETCEVLCSVRAVARRRLVMFCAFLRRRNVTYQTAYGICRSQNLRPVQ